MISTLTSPSFVNRVQESWQAGYGVTQSSPVSGGPFTQAGFTLDMNFAAVPQQNLIWVTDQGLTVKTFNEIVTFTRASTGTYFDAAGNLQSAGSNVARFDYDPSTLAPLGLLIEEQRTNSIRNNTMVGAVAGTPGTLPTNWSVSGASAAGLTRTVVGVGTEKGISYIDLQFQGTPAAGSLNIIFENAASSATLNQMWAQSAYVAIVGGSLDNLSSLNLRFDEGSPYVRTSTTTIIATLTPQILRYSGSATIGATTTQITAVYFNLFCASAPIDVTLRIGLPQLELGAFATSVIPTTTAAATRAADVAPVNTLSPWYNQSEGTLYTEVIAPQTFSNFPAQAMIHDGSASNYLLNNFQSTGAPRFERSASGVVATPINASPFASAGSLVKQASAFAVNNFALVANGGTPVTSASGNMPIVSTLRIGGYLNSTAIGNLYNGYIRRITYYPRRLSNNELQAITT